MIHTGCQREHGTPARRSRTFFTEPLMKLRETDQRRQEAPVDRERRLERATLRVSIRERGARRRQVQPQLGGARIAAARVLKMLRGRQRAASRKRVEAEYVASDGI